MYEYQLIHTHLRKQVVSGYYTHLQVRNTQVILYIHNTFLCWTKRFLSKLSSYCKALLFRGLYISQIDGKV